MVTKRVIVIPILIWLILLSVLIFFRYDKIVREKDSIAFIPYHYGKPEVQRAVRCPLRSVDTIRICTTSGPNFWKLTYTLNGKDYPLIGFGVGDSPGGPRKVSPQDYNYLIHKIKKLASKTEDDGFYFSTAFTPLGFAQCAFICFMLAGGIGVALSKA